MHKRLIAAFLLVVAAIALGSTLFREQIVSAATTPFQNVVVQNTNTNPIPVQQVGTSTASVSGTVGIDPSKNTVKLDSAGNTVKLDSNGNTVSLDSADSGHLAKIENELGNLKFDSSGNLETTAQTASPDEATGHCVRLGLSTVWAVTNDHAFHSLCSDDFYITDITASGMDDDMQVAFYLKGTLVYELQGASTNGASSYQVDLTHPLHVDDVEAACYNASTSCTFTLALLGNSTGN